MKYKDLFIDFDDTLYDTHGNSMIALKKLFDERHWEKIMPSYEAFRDAYFATNVDVWAKYAHGEIDRDTLIVERYRRPVTEMVKACGGNTSWITPEWCVAASDRYGDIISRELGIVPRLSNFWTISRARDIGCISVATASMRYSTEN